MNMTESNRTFESWIVRIALCAVLSIALVLMAIPLNAQPAYAAAPKVKITWNANGGKIGTAKVKTISYTKGKKIGKLQSATRNGYTLKGWYDKKSGGKKISKNTKAAKRTTFYAQWTKHSGGSGSSGGSGNSGSGGNSNNDEKVVEYTLTFDPNGGTLTGSNTKKVKKDDKYGDLPTATRPGYTFDGWFTAQAGGTKVTADTKMGSVDVTVYAQWTRVLNAAEQYLVGTWVFGTASGAVYNDYTGAYIKTTGAGRVEVYYPDGTYYQYNQISLSTTTIELFHTANYAVKDSKIYITNLRVKNMQDGKIVYDWKSSEDYSMYYYAGEIRYGDGSGGEYLLKNEKTPVVIPDPFNSLWDYDLHLQRSA